jgi:hypothetical protein
MRSFDPFPLFGRTIRTPTPVNIMATIIIITMTIEVTGRIEDLQWVLEVPSEAEKRLWCWHSPSASRKKFHVSHFVEDRSIDCKSTRVHYYWIKFSNHFHL